MNEEDMIIPPHPNANLPFFVYITIGECGVDMSASIPIDPNDPAAAKLKISNTIKILTDGVPKVAVAKFRDKIDPDKPRVKSTGYRPKKKKGKKNGPNNKD